MGAGLLLSAYNVLFLFGILAALWFRRLTVVGAWIALLAELCLFVGVGLGKVYGFSPLVKEWRTLGFGLGAMGIVAGLGDASYAI